MDQKRRAIASDETKPRYGGKHLRLEGGGQHAFDDDLEDELVQWITERRGNGLCVSRKLIQLKAKKMQEEKTITDLNSKTISFSDGWVQKFMRRHGLSIRRRTTEAQKNPSQLIDKLCAYVVKVRKLRQRVNYDMEDIIAIYMDETAVWNDMIETQQWRKGEHIQLA